MQKNGLKDVIYQKISVAGIFNNSFTMQLVWIMLFKKMKPVNMQVGILR